MDKNRALLIVDRDMKNNLMHSGDQVVADDLAKRFLELDLVSITKMYDGPGTDPIWRKALLGLRDVFCKRVKTISSGNVVHHIVRFPRLPAVFAYLFRDFWNYANLRTRLKDHYDLCVFRDPGTAFVALWLKHLGKVDVLIYDDNDYVPDLYPGDFFWHHIMRFRERICVRRADAVVSVSSGLQDLRTQQGAKRTILIYNGVDYGLFASAQEKKPHPPTLLYMGTLAKAWGADLPILALPIIKRQIPGIRYVVLGKGPDENRLRALVQELGLKDSVSFRWEDDYGNLPRYLAEADIGVATFRESEFRKYACPLKIFEYMAAGLPVIGTPVGEMQIIIKKATAGETVSFSPEAFADAVFDLLSNQNRYDLYSANAINFARDHDWNRMLDKRFAFVEQLAEAVCHVCESERAADRENSR
jgi:glycosyltransferase involved in cell wall biosynthesis